MSTQETHRLLSKKKSEVDTLLNQLNEAKDNHKNAMVSDTVAAILHVLNDEGKLDERTLMLFLGSLAQDVKYLYSKL